MVPIQLSCFFWLGHFLMVSSSLRGAIPTEFGQLTSLGKWSGKESMLVLWLTMHHSLFSTAYSPIVSWWQPAFWKYSKWTWKASVFRSVCCFFLALVHFGWTMLILLCFLVSSCLINHSSDSASKQWIEWNTPNWTDEIDKFGWVYPHSRICLLLLVILSPFLTFYIAKQMPLVFMKTVFLALYQLKLETLELGLRL